MHDEYAYVFKALSHRSRLKLLRLLAMNGEMSVSELANAMPREGSTVSRHLGALRMHGLVRARQQGQSRYYSLDSQGIQEVFRRFLQEELGIEA